MQIEREYITSLLPKVDFVGVKCNKLTVISFVGKVKVISNGKNKYIPYWKCLCECGNTSIVSQYALVNKKTKSCGCALSTCKLGVIRLPIYESQKRRVYKDYEQAAIKKGRIFNLTLEYFKELISEKCFYCDSPPLNIIYSGNKQILYKYNGVDRIDNNLGYVEGNVVTCCKNCNIAKHTMDKDKFLDLISKIYNKHFI